MSESLGTPIANDWRKDVSSQTVEFWRRDRQRSRALVGWKCWLHHPERFTDSDSDATRKTERDMSAPSDGGEEAVAPRVPPVPAKPTQAEQDEHCATGALCQRSWTCVTKRECSCGRVA